MFSNKQSKISAKISERFHKLSKIWHLLRYSHHCHRQAKEQSLQWHLKLALKKATGSCMSQNVKISSPFSRAIVFSLLPCVGGEVLNHETFATVRDCWAPAFDQSAREACKIQLRVTRTVGIRWTFHGCLSVTSHSLLENGFSISHLNCHLERDTLYNYEQFFDNIRLLFGQ